MPVTRVAIRKGKSAAYKQAILDGIYAAQLDTVHISEGDRFMALSEHEASEFAYGANFLGIGRTDELVQIQVFWAVGDDLTDVANQLIAGHKVARSRAH